ncbi:MAG: hypothetical protein ACK5X6_06735, partial [Chryseotalea sp.]
ISMIRSIQHGNHGFFCDVRVKILHLENGKDPFHFKFVSLLLKGNYLLHSILAGLTRIYF